jgi:hypothetical protein
LTLIRFTSSGKRRNNQQAATQHAGRVGAIRRGLFFCAGAARRARSVLPLAYLRFLSASTNY